MAAVRTWVQWDLTWLLQASAVGEQGFPLAAPSASVCWKTVSGSTLPDEVGGFRAPWGEGIVWEENLP